MGRILVRVCELAILLFAVLAGLFNVLGNGWV